MKRILILYSLLYLFLNVAIADFNQSIKRYIKNYLLKKYNIIISNSEIKLKSIYPIIYKLYEFNIISDNIENNKILLKIKVNDFFNKEKFKIIEAFVDKVLPEYKNKKIGDIVKILYEQNNIKFIDTGKIVKFKKDYIIIVNSFNKKVKCIPIDIDLYRVIE